MTDLGLVSISQLPGVRLLTITGSNITEEGIQALSNMTQLQMLNFDMAGYYDSPEVTDDSILHLASLVNLTTLQLGDCEITDVGLHFLKQLAQHSLRDLKRMRCNYITGNGLR